MPREITDPKERAETLAALAMQRAGKREPLELRPRLQGSVMPEMPQPDLRAPQNVPILGAPTGQAVEGFATPFAEMVEGIAPGAVEPETLERMRAPGGLAKTVGRVGGEVASMAGPAATAYRAARLGTATRPFLQRVAPLTAESGAVGAVEATKAPTEDQGRLERAAKAALLNQGVGAGMGALSRTIAPRMFQQKELIPQEEAFLRSQGIEPRIPLVLRGEGTGPTSKTLGWLQGEPLRSMPLFGEALKRQTDEALTDWREAILRSTVPESARGSVRMPSQFAGEQAPIRKTLGSIQDWYSRQYGEVLDPYAFNLRSQEMWGPVREAIVDIPVTGARKKVAKKIRELFEGRMDKYGAVTGSDISGIKRSIYDLIRKEKDGDRKRGYFAVLEALDQGVKDRLQSVNPQHAERYAQLAAPYRRLQVVQDASTRARAELGEFVPKDLASATVGKVKKESSVARAARGAGPLQEEAERAVRLYGDALRFRDERLFKALALGGSAVGIAGGAAVPTAGIWAGLGSTVPMASQRYLMGQYPLQQQMRQGLAEPAVEEAVRALRLGAGAYERTE